MSNRRGKKRRHKPASERRQEAAMAATTRRCPARFPDGDQPCTLDAVAHDEHVAIHDLYGVVRWRS